MRLSSQNSQFIFNLPVDFISIRLYAKFQKILDSYHVQYDNVLDYLNSTIKEIIVPSMTFENTEQRGKYGKKLPWRSATNIFDTFQQELDITFRSVDSHLNYFILSEIIQEWYQTSQKKFVPVFALHILDKHGDLLYTILFKNIIIKTLSELRLSYQIQDFSEKQFSLTFRYAYSDTLYEIKDSNLDDSQSIFDLPINMIKGDDVDDHNRFMDDNTFKPKPNPNL